MSNFKNRIVANGEEDPEALVANPLNWRIHPKHQQEALEAVVEDVGWVSGVIVNRRTGFVVDGHLRVSMALRKHEKTIPVQYVDLSEDEEKIVLATLDPIGAMAATDREKMAELLGGLKAEDERVTSLLDDIRKNEGIEGGGTLGVDTPGVGGFASGEQFEPNASYEFKVKFSPEMAAARSAFIEWCKTWDVTYKVAKA